jgi:hypothetical protein
MDDGVLAEMLLRNHFTATAALIALMLKNLPDDVRTRTLDAVRNGTGKVELRTRVESNERSSYSYRQTDPSRYGWREQRLKSE